MSNNLMPEVAKLLGVEIGEKFMIRQNKYIFEDSFFMLDKDNGLLRILDDGNFEEENAALYHVLSGKIDIIKLPWEPKYGEPFYTYIFNDVHNEWLVELLFWFGTPSQLAVKQLGMVYRTEAEAQAHLAEDYKRLTGKPLSRGG